MKKLIGNMSEFVFKKTLKWTSIAVAFEIIMTIILCFSKPPLTITAICILVVGFLLIDVIAWLLFKKAAEGEEELHESKKEVEEAFKKNELITIFPTGKNKKKRFLHDLMLLGTKIYGERKEEGYVTIKLMLENGKCVYYEKVRDEYFTDEYEIKQNE